MHLTRAGFKYRGRRARPPKAYLLRSEIRSNYWYVSMYILPNTVNIHLIYLSSVLHIIHSILVVNSYLKNIFQPL